MFIYFESNYQYIYKLITFVSFYQEYKKYILFYVYCASLALQIPGRGSSDLNRSAMLIFFRSAIY